MYDPEEIIVEINLTVLVDGELKELNIPVPYDYDGQEVLQLLMADVVSLDALGGDDGLGLPEHLQDELLDLPELAGQMDAEAFGDWKLRERDLFDIDCLSSELEDRGLLPGCMPGAYDMRLGEPSVVLLDETIEHDLSNVAIIDGGGKAAFRAMREACGASQAALAEALGVGVRTVKRWETPGQPEPPRDAVRLVESWHADAMAGARWHVSQAEELREDFHEAYTLVVYRSQEDFDRVLAPMLANAPSYRWQDALEEARTEALERDGDDSRLEIDRPYTNFPGTRSYWRANAAARIAAAIMDVQMIPYGFAYVDDRRFGLGGQSIWVPRADVQRIETADGTLVVCGMR